MSNIRDINPLEHLTSDMAKSRFNYESILNGLVEWSNSKMDDVTVRLATDVPPYFVDYTFPTRKGYSTPVSGMVDLASDTEMFSVANTYSAAALYDPDVTKCDSFRIRIDTKSNAGARWGLYCSAVLYEDQGATASRNYCPGLYVIRIVGGSKVLCRTVADIAKGDTWSSDPFDGQGDSNWLRVVENYDSHRLAYYSSVDDIMVIYGGVVYVATGDVSDGTVPGISGSGWTRVCDTIESVDRLLHHHMYYAGGMFHIYMGDSADPGVVPSPAEDTDGLFWGKPVYYLRAFDVSGTKTERWSVPTDIEGFVIRQDTDITDNETLPDIGMGASLEVNSGVSQMDPHQGVRIFDTSNYSLWPTSDNAVWSGDAQYSTDVAIPATSTQEYTARMVFHHSYDDTKTVNIINYDGPDLDQGLAIYLPVRDRVVEDGVETYKEPCDGYTFEFLFRIWPRPEYNGRTTSDLIINKAHIYVYSVDSAERLTGYAPIAKFSMARLTNFYVFSENIGVPNRPVLYKAKFVYSAEERRWKTYDYYQFPDHVFLSPAGFVDPSVRNQDTYGLETAGFPLYQDPFSGPKLERLVVDSEYMNRMATE